MHLTSSRVFRWLRGARRGHSTRFCEPHAGPGALWARPPERSGARGPRERRRWGVRRGEAPRSTMMHLTSSRACRRIHAALVGGFVLFATATSHVQQPPADGPPRLVVILVVDQMRADYLDWYGPLLTKGFHRLTERGAWFTNAAYPLLEHCHVRRPLDDRYRNVPLSPRDDPQRLARSCDEEGARLHGGSQSQGNHVRRSASGHWRQRAQPHAASPRRAGARARRRPRARDVAQAALRDSARRSPRRRRRLVRRSRRLVHFGGVHEEAH